MANRKFEQELASGCQYEPLPRSVPAPAAQEDWQSCTHSLASHSAAHQSILVLIGCDLWL